MARDWNNNEMSVLEFEFEVAVAVEVIRVGPKCFFTQILQNHRKVGT